MSKQATNENQSTKRSRSGNPAKRMLLQRSKPKLHDAGRADDSRRVPAAAAEGRKAIPAATPAAPGLQNDAPYKAAIGRAQDRRGK